MYCVESKTRYGSPFSRGVTATFFARDHAELVLALDDAVAGRHVARVLFFGIERADAGTDHDAVRHGRRDRDVEVEEIRTRCEAERLCRRRLAVGVAILDDALAAVIALADGVERGVETGGERLVLRLDREWIIDATLFAARLHHLNRQLAVLARVLFQLKRDQLRTAIAEDRRVFGLVDDRALFRFGNEARGRLWRGARLGRLRSPRGPGGRRSTRCRGKPR